MFLLILLDFLTKQQTIYTVKHNRIGGNNCRRKEEDHPLIFFLQSLLKIVCRRICLFLGVRIFTARFGVAL